MVLLKTRDLFSPSFDHQTKINVSHETNDPNLIDTKNKGVMEIAKSDGTKIRMTSFLDGFCDFHLLTSDLS